MYKPSTYKILANVIKPAWLSRSRPTERPPSAIAWARWAVFNSLYVFQCCKWSWSCLPLSTAACLHSVSNTALFF